MNAELEQHIKDCEALALADHIDAHSSTAIRAVVQALREADRDNHEYHLACISLDKIIPWNGVDNCERIKAAAQELAALRAKLEAAEADVAKYKGRAERFSKFILQEVPREKLVALGMPPIDRIAHDPAIGKEAGT